MINQHQLQVVLSNYSIDFGSAENILKTHLTKRKYSSIIILADENSHHHCLPNIASVTSNAQIIKISSGELHKNLDTCNYIWDKMRESGLDRHAIMINLGGGVIGDMGGFVASTYMRGVDFIQVPTTLLSQVDASVGGKLGVDFKGLKNFIGLFNNPKAVIIDTNFLESLPPEQVKSGYAEMIKHALIRDEKMWKRFIQNIDWKKNVNKKDIRESIIIKKKVVEEDPHEKGLRKILNFGHTLGHAIETYSFNTEKPLLHGYAIALGMIGETYLSYKKLGLSEEALKATGQYIRDIYKINTPLYRDIDSIMSLLKYDKKNISGKVMFSLLNEIGDCTYDIQVDEVLVRESLEYTLDYQ